MKTIFRIGVCALVLCLLSMSAPVASSDQSDLSVGDFAVRLATMITQKPAIAPEEAVEYLGHLGVELEAALDASVTEEMMVDAFGELGVRLTTVNPAGVVADESADRLFELFDRKDSMFSAEIFRLCKGGASDQNTPCVTDADCDGGFCQELQSIKCVAGPNDGQMCMSNADCPMGHCNIPPGQLKKLNPASPDD
jgi:hypothetical protein